MEGVKGNIWINLILNESFDKARKDFYYERNY